MEGLQRYQLAALALNSMHVIAGYTKTRMHATVKCVQSTYDLLDYFAPKCL